VLIVVMLDLFVAAAIAIGYAYSSPPSADRWYALAAVYLTVEAIAHLIEWRRVVRRRRRRELIRRWTSERVD
jgi:hypothetical protein